MTRRPRTQQRKRVRNRQHVASYATQREHVGDKTRLRLAAFFVLLMTLLITLRLGYLMIFEHDFYTALAAGTHTLYEQLYPERGNVYVQDSRTGEEFALAINKDVFTVFVDTRSLTSIDDRELLLDTFSEVFGYDDMKRTEEQEEIDELTGSSTIKYIEHDIGKEKKEQLMLELSSEDDPYVPIEKAVEEDIVDELKAKELPGIGFVRHPARFYPEGRLAAQTIGFVGKTEDGSDIGRYGIEGYWQDELAGSGGFIEASKSRAGWIIPLAEKSFEPAQDGADIVLTIDRTLQYKACERLREAMEEYQSQTATLVIMDPKTGAILTMCSLPDFDPNEYGNVDSLIDYNNTAIFRPYEPGSIFKPITMAAALDQNKVTPDTYFYDNGSREANCTKPIKNAEGKAYKDQTMTGILENSINTGMVFTVEQLGKKTFISYLEQFGFGLKSGLPIDSEISGTIDTLYVNKKDEIDCYTATASFGQGITATPLQMVTAFSAIANGGKMMKPHIVKEVRYADGKIKRIEPEMTKQIISSRAASLLSAMLVRVIDNGQAGIAGVDGYFIAGKTGTAQIAGPGGYTADTNQSFIGFGPVADPKFVMIVKFEKPQRAYSVSTAAPVFRDVATFILDYYHVPPER